MDEWPLWYAMAMGQLSMITNKEQEDQFNQAKR